MPELVEALYHYSPQSSEDMTLEPGQRVEVQEHLSNDWARGKNLTTGQTGVFPKNYVKLIEEKAKDSEKFSRPAAAPPTDSGSSGYPQGFDNKQQYQPPAASWQQPQQMQAPPPQYQQAPYQPPQQYEQYQPPQQVVAPQPQQQPQQGGGRHHGQFGNIARRFGDSMLFGAGATLGSDIINKIF